MEKLPLGIARKIQQLLKGELLPFSQLKSPLIKKMIDEGIIQVKIQGRSRQHIYNAKPELFRNYLINHLGINDIQFYIDNLERGNSRAENIIASSNSKSSHRRTFKGFLANCLRPLSTEINGQQFLLQPQEGTFTFIYDYETFQIPADTLVVGVENPENFRFINKQAAYFRPYPILFVSRYPQSGDFIKWMKSNQNQYLHFGDFDFEGIRIYKDEYQKHLEDRSAFFIPLNIEFLLNKYGNGELYDKQYKFQKSFTLGKEIDELVELFHKYKKCLEQEILVKIKHNSHL